MKEKKPPARPLTTLEKSYRSVLQKLGKLSKHQLIMLRDEINKEVMK